MFNTVRLIVGEGNFPHSRWGKRVVPGDQVYGIDNSSRELMRWTFTEETEDAVMSEAKSVLAAKRNECILKSGYVFATEYALEVFESDEDGEFICGSDYSLAEAEYFGFPSCEDDMS